MWFTQFHWADGNYGNQMSWKTIFLIWTLLSDRTEFLLYSPIQVHLLAVSLDVSVLVHSCTILVHWKGKIVNSINNGPRSIHPFHPIRIYIFGKMSSEIVLSFLNEYKKHVPSDKQHLSETNLFHFIKNVCSFYWYLPITQSSPSGYPMMTWPLQPKFWQGKVPTQRENQIQHLKLHHFSYITQSKLQHILYNDC